MEKSLVLFSSGHDSFYCLCKAVEEFGKENVKCLIFNYGQTNPLEITNAMTATIDIGIPSELISLPKLNISTNDKVSPQYYASRNLVFLSIGTAIAESQGYSSIYMGICKEDNDLFPDCRDEFVKAFENVRNAAYNKVEIFTPCLSVSKKQSYDYVMHSELKSAYEKYVYSCYNNSEDSFNGRKGCGYCGACVSIRKGVFNEKVNG